MNVTKGYGYQDLLLVPQLSELDSRKEVEIMSFLDSDLMLAVPIIGAAMDTVTEKEMAAWLAANGAIGIIHRYMHEQDQADQVAWAKVQSTSYRFSAAAAAAPVVGASVGASDESRSRVDLLLKAKADLIAIDVAHGDSTRVFEMIAYIKGRSPKTLVMSGNIATPEGAKRAAEAGADIFRVGIGPGSACTTRLVAGVGVPQLTAISEIHQALWGYPIVADGGVRQSGDVVKALAAGASAVMVGGRLASYPWTPRPGQYRGMASADALAAYKGMYDPYTVEGAGFETNILSPYEAEQDWAQFVGGIRQGLAYLGAENIAELQEKATWIEVSDLGYREGEATYGS